MRQTVTQIQKTALIIVDVQPDFLPGGALAVPDGDRVLAPITQLARSGDFALIVASRDAHPADHMSFVAHGGIWPPHCIDGRPGAELHRIIAKLRPHIVNKATERHVDAYSAFQGTGLGDLLRSHDITKIVVVGLATDYCVLETVLDGRREGFIVEVVRDAIAAVNVNPGDDARALEQMTSPLDDHPDAALATIVNLADVLHAAV
jgi:nicotinamidase-related amidase